MARCSRTIRQAPPSSAALRWDADVQVMSSADTDWQQAAQRLSGKPEELPAAIVSPQTACRVSCHQQLVIDCSPQVVEFDPTDGSLATPKEGPRRKEVMEGG